MTTPLRVMVCSPYSAPTTKERERNIKYAWACMRDAVERGEAPFASHLLYTQSKDGRWAAEVNGETDEAHWISRQDGLRCESAWRAAAERIVFYTDRGWSRGMHEAKVAGAKAGLPMEERRLGSHASKCECVRVTRELPLEKGTYTVVDETGSHLRGEWGNVTLDHVRGLCNFLSAGCVDLCFETVDGDRDMKLLAHDLRAKGYDIVLHTESTPAQPPAQQPAQPPAKKQKEKRGGN